MPPHRRSRAAIVALFALAGCDDRAGLVSRDVPSDAPSTRDVRDVAIDVAVDPGYDAPPPTCVADVVYPDVPARDAGDVRAVEIALGAHHTCARLSDGTVRCWGRNARGQLGDGTTTDRAAPTAVANLADVAGLAAGAEHTCARTTAGTVACWGGNSFGQLGDGTQLDRAMPTSVALPGAATQLATGGAHTCAGLAPDGALRCWGRNAFGQLGDGTRDDRMAPVAIQTPPGLAEIALGAVHSCARTPDGVVRCWGSNADGQVGDCRADAHASAAIVAGVARATQLAAGGRHTCAVLEGGALSCWGTGLHGQLGFAVQASTMRCPDPTGAGANESLPYAVPSLADVAGVALGAAHSCARTTRGDVACWGANLYGQIATCIPDVRSTPGVVALPPGVTQVALGEHHSCALAEGHVWCWGDNQFGQLGDGGSLSRFVPGRVDF